MSFDPISAAFDLGKTAIERIWPDPVKQAEELNKLTEIKQKGDLAQLNAHVQLMLGQLKVNEAEAKNPSLIVAGWRPAIGWVGAAAMAYQFIAYPLLIWVWATLQAAGHIPTTLSPPPMLNTGALFSIITGMLGIGTMRSIDKRNGVDTKHVGQ